MNKWLLCFFLLLLVNCGGKPGNEDITEFTHWEVVRDTMGDFVSTHVKPIGSTVITEDEDYPKSLFDKPIPEYKRKLFENKPVKEKRAAWNAALTALKQGLPNPEAPIIFNYSKLDRQVNSENQCLFIGEIEAKDSEGNYREFHIRILTTYKYGDPEDPQNWDVEALITD